MLMTKWLKLWQNESFRGGCGAQENLSIVLQMLLSQWIYWCLLFCYNCFQHICEVNCEKNLCWFAKFGGKAVWQMQPPCTFLACFGLDNTWASQTWLCLTIQGVGPKGPVLNFGILATCADKKNLFICIQVYGKLLGSSRVPFLINHLRAIRYHTWSKS